MKHSANPSGKPVVLISGYRGLAESFLRTFSGDFQLSVFIRNPGAVSELQKKFSSALFIVGDLANHSDCLRWIAETHNQFGRIDALINNAAITGPAGRLGDYPFEKFEEAIRINFLAPVSLCHQALPHLVRSPQGTIINLSGGGATGPRPYFSAYGTSKTALVRFTENLAMEYPEIRTYAMSPGSLMTPMIEKVAKIDPALIGKEHLEASRRIREGGDDPQRAADLAFWLCTERPRSLNGRVISAIWDKYKSPPSFLESTDLWTLRRVDEVLFRNLKGKPLE